MKQNERVSLRACTNMMVYPALCALAFVAATLGVLDIFVM